jgi:hypothetical protein
MMNLDDARSSATIFDPAAQLRPPSISALEQSMIAAKLGGSVVPG